MNTVDIGIDFGESAVRVYIKGKGIVIDEPAIVAVDRSSRQIVAVGEKAKIHFHKFPECTWEISPFQGDFNNCFDKVVYLVEYYVTEAMKMSGIGSPSVAVCVPFDHKDMLAHTVRGILYMLGAGEVFVKHCCILAAIGAGVDLHTEYARLIIDMGARTTDVAVISRNRIVGYLSVETAGNELDNAITLYMRKTHYLLITDEKAREIKHVIGKAISNGSEDYMNVEGRSLVSGFPTNVVISCEEIRVVLQEILSKIIDAIHEVIWRTPLEISSRLSGTSIVLTGGGSMLGEIGKYIFQKTGLDVIIPPNADIAVVMGLSRYPCGETVGKFLTLNEVSSTV